MEDTLRVGANDVECLKAAVLILVLMEDTLRVFIGLASISLLRRLNPCFNGRYSQSQINIFVLEARVVLILVLMEDTLRDKDISIWQI